jgi:catechol 2,3-dioxygenase-like lactoylglutathione lyase family enzyme
LFFRVSPCVGLSTPDLDSASRFYCDAMGMELESFEDGAELLAGPLRIFLDPGPRSSAVFELLAPDLDGAQGKLKFYGFEVVAWNGVGRANIVRDPFGLVFNIFEFDEADTVELDLGEHRVYRPMIGAVTPSPKPLAEFYSMVLQQPANRLTDGSYLLGGSEVSMRIRPGEVDAQVLWLSHDAPVEHYLDAGCRPLEDDNSVITDPYGLSWAVETRIQSSHAVVNPL